MRMKALTAALMLAIPATLHAQADSSATVDRIAAVVGSVPILYSDVMMQVERIVGEAAGTGRMADSAQRARIMREVLENFINQEILIKVAEQEEITVDPDRLERAVEIFIEQRRQEVGTNDAFIAALARFGYGSLAAYRSALTDQMRRDELPRLVIQQLSQKGKLPEVPVPDSLVEAEFPARRAVMGRKPASVTFRQIIMATRPSEASRKAARAHAESLLVRLRAGEDFEDMARKESADTATSYKGGDLDWRRRGSFVPEFERYLFGLAPTMLSPVVETSYGYHIIRVDRVEPAQVKGRHILIRPKVDSTDFAATRALADSVAVKARAGASFDSLAKVYMDPDLLGEVLIADRMVDSLPVNYRTALQGLAPGAVSAAFSTDDPRNPMPAHVILLVVEREEARDYTDEEVRQSIRNALRNAAAVQSFLDKKRKQLYIRVML